MANLALVWVIVSALGRVTILAFDWWLERSSISTITERVRLRPWRGVPVLLLDLSGTVALAVHFYWR